MVHARLESELPQIDGSLILQDIGQTIINCRQITGRATPRIYDTSLPCRVAAACSGSPNQVVLLARSNN
jgi:hypothetical protein